VYDASRPGTRRRIVLGLNRQYYVGFRSLEAAMNDLDVAPNDLLGRIRAIYPLAFGRTKELVLTLVEETYDLLEEHVPELPVERWRTFLRYERPLWDAEPPN
jgi:hypothetical protein